VDQAKLNSAPSFEKSQIPDFSQSDWSQKIYSHYGMSWREGASGSSGGTGSGIEKSGSGSSTDKGAGASGLQPKSGTSE
jgi:hypothetical protein